MKPEIKYRLIERLIQLEDEGVLKQIQEILEGAELSKAHKQILDKRLSDFKANPGDVLDWEEVKAQIEKNL